MSQADIERLVREANQGDLRAFQEMLIHEARQGADLEWYPVMPFYKAMWDRARGDVDPDALGVVANLLEKTASFLMRLNYESKRLQEALEFFLSGHTWEKTENGKKWHCRTTNSRFTLCGRELGTIHDTHCEEIKDSKRSIPEMKTNDACMVCESPYFRMKRLIFAHYSEKEALLIVNGWWGKK